MRETPGPYARLPMPDEITDGVGFEVAGWGGTHDLRTFDFDDSAESNPLHLSCPRALVSPVTEPMCQREGLLVPGDSGSPLTTHPIGGERLLAGIVSNSAGAMGGTFARYDVYADLLGHHDGVGGADVFEHRWREYLPGPQSAQRAGRWVLRDDCSADLSDARGYTAPSWYETIQAADVDADGDADVIARESDGIHVYRDEGGAYARVNGADLGVPTLVDVIGFDRPQAYLSIQTGDFDRDGQADLIVLHEGTVLMFASSGNDPRFDGVYSVSTVASLEGFGTLDTIHVVDLDGDGWDDVVGVRTPLLGVGPVRVLAHLNDRTPRFEFTAVEQTLPDPSLNRIVHFADLVPTGGEELVLLGMTGGHAALDVYGWDDGASELRFRTTTGPSDGADGTCDLEALTTTSGWQYSSTLVSGRFVGTDACDDLAMRCPGGLHVWASTCTVDADLRETAVGAPIPLRDTAPYRDDPSTHIRADWGLRTSYGTVRAGDVDGDGLDDVVARSPHGMLTFLSDGAGRLESASVFEPALTDGAGYDTLDRTQPIQLVDLDGDLDSELVVRAACGLRTYDFVASVRRSAALTTSLTSLRLAGVPFVRIARLAPWQDDPRLHERAVRAAVEALQRHGWRGRVVVRDASTTLVAGHALVAAALELGLSEVPVVRLEHAGEDARLYARAE